MSVCDGNTITHYKFSIKKLKTEIIWTLPDKKKKKYWIIELRLHNRSYAVDKIIKNIFKISAMEKKIPKAAKPSPNVLVLGSSNGYFYGVSSINQ